MKTAPYKIGSQLKHLKTGKIIELLRYDTQLTYSMHLSIDGSNTKTIPNYNYLYGIYIDTGDRIDGLTKEFAPVNQQ